MEIFWNVNWKRSRMTKWAYGNYHMELQAQDGSVVTVMTVLMDSSLLCVNTGRRHFHTWALLILTQSLWINHFSISQRKKWRLEGNFYKVMKLAGGRTQTLLTLIPVLIAVMLGVFFFLCCRKCENGKVWINCSNSCQWSIKLSQETVQGSHRRSLLKDPGNPPSQEGGKDSSCCAHFTDADPEESGRNNQGSGPSSQDWREGTGTPASWPKENSWQLTFTRRAGACWHWE